MGTQLHIYLCLLNKLQQGRQLDRKVVRTWNYSEEVIMVHMLLIFCWNLLKDFILNLSLPIFWLNQTFDFKCCSVTDIYVTPL